MAKRELQIRLAASFERNIEELAAFLAEADAMPAYDALLDELVETVIPNLERFPEMGRPFFSRDVCSVEGINALERLASADHAVLDAINAAARTIVQAVQENGGEIVIGDDVIYRSFNRARQSQSIMLGGAY